MFCLRYGSPIILNNTKQHSNNNIKKISFEKLKNKNLLMHIDYLTEYNTNKYTLCELENFKLLNFNNKFKLYSNCLLWHPLQSNNYDLESYKIWFYDHDSDPLVLLNRFSNFVIEL